jgi:hypothetical protein
MKRWLLATMILLLYLLHQDFWNWREARPLVFGFLPVGLVYHACFTLGVSGAMWLLVRHAWPSHLETAPKATGPEEPSGDSSSEEDDPG